MLLWCSLFLLIGVWLFGLVVAFVVFCLFCGFGMVWLFAYYVVIVLVCLFRFEFAGVW